MFSCRLSIFMVGIVLSFRVNTRPHSLDAVKLKGVYKSKSNNTFVTRPHSLDAVKLKGVYKSKSNNTFVTRLHSLDAVKLKGIYKSKSNNTFVTRLHSVDTVKLTIKLRRGGILNGCVKSITSIFLKIFLFFQANLSLVILINVILINKLCISFKEILLYR